jgi:hypothetical protein
MLLLVPSVLTLSLSFLADPFEEEPEGGSSAAQSLVSTPSGLIYLTQSGKPSLSAEERLVVTLLCTVTFCLVSICFVMMMCVWVVRHDRQETNPSEPESEMECDILADLHESFRRTFFSGHPNCDDLSSQA